MLRGILKNYDKITYISNFKSLNAFLKVKGAFISHFVAVLLYSDSCNNGIFWFTLKSISPTLSEPL